MEEKALGFFVKPKFSIKNEGKDVKNVFLKEYENINIYLRNDGLFTIELKKLINNLDDENSFLKNIEYNIFYTQYANIIYFMFKNSYDKIITKYEMELSPIILYEVVGNESIVVIKRENIWEVHSSKGDPYGSESYNSVCAFSKKRILVETTQLEEKNLKEILEDFEKNLDIILADKNAMQIVLLFQKAHMNMINEQYDISILLNWTVIERIINNMWEEILDEKVSNNRKKTILDNKEYTASIKTNELLINNKIDNNLANEIDRARRIRNQIMHGQYNMFDTNEKINGKLSTIIPLVLKEFEVSQKCLKLYYKIDFKISSLINSQLYF